MPKTTSPLPSKQHGYAAAEDLKAGFTIALFDNVSGRPIVTTIQEFLEAFPSDTSRVDISGSSQADANDIYLYYGEDLNGRKVYENQANEDYKISWSGTAWELIEAGADILYRASGSGIKAFDAVNIYDNTNWTNVEGLGSLVSNPGPTS